MTDVMPVIEEQLVLKRSCWVRLKRGIFKDDIAQVDYVDTGQSSVHLKLVPRIDYSRLRDTLRDKDAGGGDDSAPAHISMEVDTATRGRPPLPRFATGGHGH
ncbi:transcription elongation factor SPT5-like isoform X2 [Amphibalanus amphitrite]|uniref:transcription elongation factor SPT5-like isoform X2 n=1 Tax=Amphibalanus amphitrite TaxID=1232801 RepID=UPI001C913163|nr:transcription elongation factor SPT5-like isoform X2 [Amphibalanus amphitrite]